MSCLFMALYGAVLNGTITWHGSARGFRRKRELPHSCSTWEAIRGRVRQQEKGCGSAEKSSNFASPCVT